LTEYVVRLARRAGLVALFVIVAILGTISGMFFAYAGDLPQISALDDYAPSTITRVHASDGGLIGEFAIQRRVVIGYESISPTLREAIIAAEDAGFERHVGLSVPRIIITAVRDSTRGRRVGASTLTQQLARHLFLEEYMRAGGLFEVSPERKIKEAIVAIQIEKRYTKREILTFYANHMHVGHGAYGVEEAARMYFDKSARDVTLEEAAVIAGIFQSPARQSPFVDPARTRQRRNYVLQRMADEGYITQAEADEIKERPIRVVDRRPTDDTIAPYFVEEVRKHLEAKYGAKQLYESGLTVETTLDARLQEAANRALTAGLRQIDKRRGFRRASMNVLAQGDTLEGFRHPRWRRAIGEGAIVPAVVTGTDNGRIQVRVAGYRGEIAREGFAWTRRTQPDQLASVGDLIDIEITRLDESAGTLAARLEQEPSVEGALLAVDNRSGQIRAMVGGYSFERSKFNRAVQAYRQLGSSFKPIVYTAAIDRGYTPASILIDSPASFSAGAGQPPYSPKNYDRRFEGPITLRRAIEQSRNVPAVRVMEQLGPGQVISYARRFGFETPMPPYLSVALGSAEATLLEVTSAYSVFPNQGVRMRPYQILRIRDRDGNVLEENRPEPHDAIRADSAYVMTNLLRGVVQRGTGARAAALNWPLGGKTGTVDDYTDAWFVGFDPEITVGVWVGRDEKKPIGPKESGSQAALPIWIEFMKAHVEGREEAPEFPPPGNIIFLAVDRQTGDLSDRSNPQAITEAFISGTQPGTLFPRQ
jgi:penicillin-binding protein 1A